MKPLLLVVITGVLLQVSGAQTARIPILPKPDVMPKLLKSVDPEFSEEARAKKQGGRIQVHVLIDETGHVANATVVRGVGYGLDEKALEAIRQYVFFPAQTNGVAVACDIYIDVNFVIKEKD